MCQGSKSAAGFDVPPWVNGYGQECGGPQAGNRYGKTQVSCLFLFGFPASRGLLEDSCRYSLAMSIQTWQ